MKYNCDSLRSSNVITAANRLFRPSQLVSRAVAQQLLIEAP